MKVNINDTPLRNQQVPKRYKRPNGITIDGYDKKEDLHNEDGWRTPIVPEYNVETHRLGKLILDSDNVTYEVLEIPEKTSEQLKQEAIENGVTIGDFHFKDKTELNDFITQKNELEKLGMTEMGWESKDKIWIASIPFTEVQNIFLQAMQGFQSIYMM